MKVSSYLNYAVPVLVHRHIHPFLAETSSFHHTNTIHLRGMEFQTDQRRGKAKACVVNPYRYSPR